jgi:hypothetical protein
MDQFADVAIPLTRLTRKGVDFEWGPEEQASMNALKDLLIKSPAIKQIDYVFGRRVILSVDSSVRGMGYILLQLGEDGLEYLSRFGSITWNEQESRYSQAKLELYGLFCVLKAARMYLVGITDLLVRVDAKYIKGMLKNPDIQPNTTINRWIAAILLFNFEIEHTPGITHVPDGLSRRRPTSEDPEEDDDVDEWIDRACGFMIQVMNWQRQWRSSLLERIPASQLQSGGQNLDHVFTGRWTHSHEKLRNQPLVRIFITLIDDQVYEIPRSEKADAVDTEMELIKEFMEHKQCPDGMKDEEFERFV